jgi:tetratricopeptide (TPR) repeat protein
LEDLFNNKCGNLMALDKHGQTLTALKFEDKLKRFLNAVLVSDEQASRIRDAFDAYIFLSYRKKDRKYAQELMRLIHKNDFARDVAIWYDEFLTPGEDFNTNINAVLNKSVLFALTVTPNLLERGNYVMEHEYPAACSAGKPILPIEMLHTDRTGMERAYPGLPDSITDESHLSEALANALQTIALRQNDQDPEHNFFIGLAYLGGIEVERDTAMALTLITSAAEAGLPEAMDKLRGMYENGDGVKRDYRNALHWQEQLTEYRRKVWTESGDWHDGDDYAYELFYLSASYQDLEMTQQASQSAQALYDLAKDKSWGWDYRYYAAAILGDLAKDDRQFQTAKHWYDLGLQEALDAGDKAYRGQSIMYNRLSILSNMMADTVSARTYGEALLRITQKRCEVEDRRTNVIVALLNIAATWRMDRNYPRALEYVQQALELAEGIYREQENHSAEEHLALVLGVCATYNAETKAYPKALEYAHRSLELRKKLAEDTGSVSDRNQVMEAYNSLCNILLWQGEAEKAFPYCDLLLEHAEFLHQTAATAESQKQLSVVYSLRGKLCKAAGKSEDARACFQRSLDLSPDEDTTYFELFLTMGNYNALADLLETEGNYIDALPYRERVLELAQRSCDLSLSPVTLEELFISQNNLAVCFSNLKQFDRMRQHFDAALDAGEAAGDLMKQDAWYTLAISYSNVLNCYMDACDDDTLAVCLNYLRICDHLPSTSKDANLRNNLALVYSQLARYHTDHQKNEEAIAYHRLHIPLRRHLLEESNLSVHREFLADALYDLAQLMDGSGEAAELYEQALTLYRYLQREAPEVHHLFRISYCCTVLGRRCKQQGQTKQMEALFTEAEERASLLAKQTNKPGDRRRWAFALFDLIDLCFSKGNLQSAHKYLLTAQELYNGLAEEFGNMDDCRNAAVVQSRLGEVAFQSGNLEHALTLLMAASETLKQCVEEDNCQDNRLAYTGCLERLAQIYRSLGDNKTS